MYLKKACVYLVSSILLCGALVAVVSCKGPEPTTSPVSTPLSPLATPPTVQFESPLQAPEIPGPAFAIDRPLQGGVARITGQGPAGIPIVVVDVTLTGQQLGQGFIDEEGRFDIELAEPLVSGHRIGLMAGTTQQMSPEEVQAYLQQLLRWKGEGARDLPFIGLLLDTAMAE
ncbi:MAG: hypothetical protein JXA93_15335 [Anaerolineae bacterium]|nr:hypothetical protein [Anaerolineae bacterium]